MLERTNEELVAAREALDALKGALAASDIRREWSRFLDHLERSWKKSRLEAKARSGPIRAHCDRVASKRKSDELLQYLSQARSANQHSIQIGAGSGRVVRVKLPPGAGFELDLRSGTIMAEGGTIEVGASGPEPVLLPIKNRGRTYPVPTTHLGRSLGSQDPVHIAERGYEFYSEHARKLDAILSANQGPSP